MFDDPKFGNLFPTRTGTASGTANERKMLDAIGGSNNFRTRLMTNPDGSTTMLRTKNGMPQFSTTRSTQIATEIAGIYMESGQLSNCRWHDNYISTVSEWRFLDIATTESYLGTIDVNGGQRNSPALSEGCISLATTFASGDEGQSSATQEKQRKRLIVNLFPSSLFSGKMRLFMQAMYGAKLKRSGNPLTIKTSGQSYSLWYANGAGEVPLGALYNCSTGIYTAADGTWWLLVLTVSVETCSLIGYRILQKNVYAKQLVTRYRTEALSVEERTKIESYIFAHSYVDVANPTASVGFPTPKGVPIAYGWKWNTSGSRASVVAHEIVGTGANDLRWISRTVHLEISYTPGVTPFFSVIADTSENGEWTDGWGVYNIFVPEDEKEKAPLCLLSLQVDRASSKDLFDFSGIPVYGYYVDDVWTSVDMSITVKNTPNYWQQDAGILYEPALDLSAPSRYQYGYIPADQNWTYESHDVSSGTECVISVQGGGVYQGESNYGVHKYIRRTVNSVGITPNTIEWSPATLTPSSHFPGLPPGYTGTAGTMERSVTTMRSTSYVGTENRAIALIVPSLDAEAVHVAARTFNVADLTTTNIRSNWLGVMRFINADSSSYVPWTDAWSGGGWYGVDSPNLSDTVDYSPYVLYENTVVYCYNAAVTGFTGVPGGSYEGLFTVSKDYRYYDRGMYVRTSAGKRYAGSELPASPTSVSGSNLFVGWA